MFNNAIEFSTFIETSAKERNVGILEFLTEYVVLNSIDEEAVPPMLTPAIVNKIEAEARLMYSMPKRTEQEIDL